MVGSMNFQRSLTPGEIHRLAVSVEIMADGLGGATVSQYVFNERLIG